MGKKSGVYFRPTYTKYLLSEPIQKKRNQTRSVTKTRTEKKIRIVTERGVRIVRKTRMEQRKKTETVGQVVATDIEVAAEIVKIETAVEVAVVTVVVALVVLVIHAGDLAVLIAMDENDHVVLRVEKIEKESAVVGHQLQSKSN